MDEQRGPRPIVVQQSFPRHRPTTNPYIVMLGQALRNDHRVAVRTFSWRSALLGRYDVFHAHWPEILVSGRGRLRATVRRILFAVLVARLRLLRTPVVRTVHNLELPSGLTAVQRRLLLAFDGLTTVSIALNTETGLPDDRSVTVLHGHYRDWFAQYLEPEAQPGQFGYFGLIRRYKNVEGLVRAFRALDGPFALEVAGSPSSDDLQRTVSAAAAGDPRIRLRFEYLSDAELVDTCGRSQLVVLPYHHMHNSGGALAALSLDRPVLVPRNAANDRLAIEVGEEWVQRFDGELDAAALERALAGAQALPRCSRPDLSRRSWAGTADGHVRAYRMALQRRRAQSRRYSR